MSAMSTMLADILAKAIPKEVLEAMTPEKIQEYKDAVVEFVTVANNKLDKIEQQQGEILALLKGHGNGGNDNNSK